MKPHRQSLTLSALTLLLFALMMFISVSPVRSEDKLQGDECPNANILSSSLLTDICWDCMFPIKIAGFIEVGNSSGNDIPSEAYDDPLCYCTKKLDLPQIGYSLGFWQPARLVELVRTPGCLMSLNGTKAELGSSSKYGTTSETDGSLSSLAFWHYHYFSFPVLEILQLFDSSICPGAEHSAFDVLYISEIDPTWNYPELSALAFPETKVFANEISVTSCAGDAILHHGAGSSDNFFWCAGTWGTIYPVSGWVNGVGSTARMTSLLATRALSASHRRGFETKTIGKDALCRAKTSLRFVPSQYRFSMLWPMAQGGKNRIGRSTFFWGEASNASDAVYLVWRWRDCCSKYIPSLRAL